MHLVAQIKSCTLKMQHERTICERKVDIPLGIENRYPSNPNLINEFPRNVMSQRKQQCLGNQYFENSSMYCITHLHLMF